MKPYLLLFLLVFFPFLLLYSQTQDELYLQIREEMVESPREREVYDNNCPTIPPEYPGGDSALFKQITENMSLSEIPIGKYHSMRIIFVRFTIDKYGNAFNINVVKGLDPIIDKEAIRVVSTLERWKPAEKCGKAVDAPYTLPIRIIDFSGEK